MSPDEMREFCKSILPYSLQVQVRLKNGREVFVGKVSDVLPDRFELRVGNQDPMSVRYAWVARIAHAS